MNRSWSACGTGLPAVATLGFLDEPSHDDDRVGEGDPEVHDSPFPLCAPHELLVGVAPRVGPFDYPPLRVSEWVRLALLGNLAYQATLLQEPAGEGRVRAPVPLYAPPPGRETAAPP